MKNKKRLMFLLIILICIIIIVYINSINIHKYIEMERKKFEVPINFETGIINNNYFNINSKGKEAEETTKGINEAIKYAQKNNINNIKLQTGIYEVIGYKNSHYRGLVMQSNINLDLNRFKNYSKDKRQ